MPISCKAARKGASSSQRSQRPSWGQEDVCVLLGNDFCRTRLLFLPLPLPSHGAFPAPRCSQPLSQQALPPGDVEHWFQQVVAAVECAGSEAGSERGQHTARLERIYHGLLGSLPAGEPQPDIPTGTRSPRVPAVSPPCPRHPLQQQDQAPGSGPAVSRERWPRRAGLSLRKGTAEIPPADSARD